MAKSNETTIILQKVERKLDGKLHIREQRYDVEEVSNIRFGCYKDFHSEDDIVCNGLNPDDKCIYLTFYPDEKTGEVNNATFDGDWEVTFEW